MEKTMEMSKDLHIEQLQKRIQELEKQNAYIQKELQDFQERYHLLYTHTPVMLHSLDNQRTIISVSDHWLQTLDYKLSEVIGKKITEFLSTESQVYAQEVVLPEFYKTGKCQNIPYQFVTKSGQIIDVLLSAVSEKDPQGTVVRTLAVSVDITARKKAEKELHESREKYRALVETIRDWIWEIDEQGIFTYASPKIYDILGYRPEEILGKSLFDLMPFEEKNRVMALYHECVSLSAPIVGMENINRHSDGHAVVLETNGVPFFSSKGALSGYRGASRDISDRKKTAQALAAEKERLAVTLRSIGDGVITTSKDGRIEFMNQSAEQLTGWSLEDAWGKELSDVFRIVYEKNRQPVPSPVRKVIESGEIVGVANHTMLVGKDGKERMITHSSAPIKDRESKILGVVLVFRDVTEKARLEEEIQRREHLESLGLLAGGIAHDFNNLLSGIFGYIDMAKEYGRDNKKLIECLDRAVAIFQRTKDLTQQLLTFSKGGAPIKKSAAVTDIIKESAHFVLSGTNVKCDLTTTHDLWACEVDTGQLSQVINNLVINSQQAMPMGGTITITTENIMVDPTLGLPLTPGPYVKITIQDSGIGIPKQYINRIFDPFFTTKQKGSGLGLTIVYSIIKKHDGYISVSSEPGVGTSFFIYLPANLTVKISPKKGAGMTGKTDKGHGKILVVDDEPFICDLAARMLKHLGFTPVTTTDPTDAIELYKNARSGEPFVGVILDLTIPGTMGGKEAVQEILKIDSLAKVIVSSGYSDDPILANPQAYGFKGVLGKPYMLQQMSQMLHDLLKN